MGTVGTVGTGLPGLRRSLEVGDPNEAVAGVRFLPEGDGDPRGEQVRRQTAERAA